MNSMNPYKCELHQQPCQFVCAISQWHFQPLCPACLVEHSQKHAKSKSTMVLVEIDKAVEKALMRRDQFLSKYSKCRELVDSVQNICNGSSIIAQLDILRNRIVEGIDKQLASFKERLMARQHQQMKQSIAAVLELRKMLEFQASKMSAFTEKMDTCEQLETVKLLYFKESTDVYFEEVEETVNELKEQKPRGLQFSSEEIANDIQRYLEEKLSPNVELSAKLLQEEPLPAKEAKQEVVAASNTVSQKQKKPAKFVPKVAKPKLCKECNSELEYLTALKKHLVCKSCGNKQRNYSKKTDF